MQPPPSPASATAQLAVAAVIHLRGRKRTPNHGTSSPVFGGPTAAPRM
jgi:hypothetical protein